MTRDEKFMVWVTMGAQVFSTCAKGQYMSIVTSMDGRVIGTGYNGGPAGMKHCTDGGCPRGQSREEVMEEYQHDLIMGRGTHTPPDPEYQDCIAIHAEENALLHSDPALRRGGTLYVNGTPCYGCAKKIANSHIAKVVYTKDERYEAGVDLLTELDVVELVELDSEAIGDAVIAVIDYFTDFG